MTTSQMYLGAKFDSSCWWIRCGWMKEIDMLDLTAEFLAHNQIDGSFDRGNSKSPNVVRDSL